MAETKLTAQQRAQLFGASTRQHYQMIGTETATESGSVSFRVPKARLLQGLKIAVSGKIKSTHATATTCTLRTLDVYRVLRSIRVDFNNGFQPFVLSGEQAALLNLCYPAPDMVIPGTGSATNAKCPASLTSSTTGADNDFSFVLDVLLALNHRDPVSLVLAQNAETTIDITLDFASGSDVVHAQSGYTTALNNLSVSIMAASFSIPSDSRAFPDMSILKICDAISEPVTTGLNAIRLKTGQIYRKLILVFEDSNGAAFADSDITSNIELVLNGADIPYSIKPEMLRAVDRQELGLNLPTGALAFVWDYQGMPSYGGSRDYMDMERVTEFTVRFNSSKAGRMYAISERLARLVSA